MSESTIQSFETSSVQATKIVAHPVAFCPFIRDRCRSDCAALFESQYGTRYCVLIDPKVAKLESEHVTLYPLSQYAQEVPE